MIKPTFARIKHILYSFDWNGHVELPDSDLTWLAEQLSARLSASSLEVCDSCGRSMSIVVTTRLGNICSECLEEASDTADNIRDVLTGGDVYESSSTAALLGKGRSV